MMEFRTIINKFTLDEYFIHENELVLRRKLCVISRVNYTWLLFNSKRWIICGFQIATVLVIILYHASSHIQSAYRVTFYGLNSYSIRNSILKLNIIWNRKKWLYYFIMYIMVITFVGGAVVILCLACKQQKNKYFEWNPWRMLFNILF